MRALIAAALLAGCTPASVGAAPAAAAAERIDTSDAAAARVARRYLALVASGANSAARRLRHPGEAEPGDDALVRQLLRAGYRVEVGEPVAGDAGMSQRWITVPITLHRPAGSGTAEVLTGSLLLRRVVAGVGAPAGQRRWHIREVHLRSDAAEARVTYRCDDNHVVTVVFDNRCARATMTEVGRPVTVLEQQPSGSGIRYAGNGAALLGKGRDATITRPGWPPVACRADAP